MNFLFSFGTLKARWLDKKILGHDVEETPASVRGFQQRSVVADGVNYPVLAPWLDGVVSGDMLTVSDDDLAALDVWEKDHYERVSTWILPQGSAEQVLGSMYKWKGQL